MDNTSFELFGPDGHLTGQGLDALCAGELEEELQRLEAAEHLGFCDECLLRYTALLADDALLAPEAPLLPGVTRAQRRRRVRLAVARYATVAAAACLAVVMWGAGSGVLARWQAGGKAAEQQDTAQAAPPQTQAQPQPGWGARISQGLNEMASGLDSFFGTFAGRGGQQNQPARDDATYRQREKLFDQGKAAAGGTAGQAAAPEDDSAAAPDTQSQAA